MNRFTEPSTWAGIAGLGQLLKTFLPPQHQWIGDAITGVAGAAAVGMKEKPKGA